MRAANPALVLDLANDVGTARINVSMDGSIVGIALIIVRAAVIAVGTDRYLFDPH